MVGRVPLRGAIAGPLVVLGDLLLWGTALLGLAGLMVPAARGAIGTALLFTVPLALLLALVDASRLARYTVGGMVAAGALLAVTVGTSIAETSAALTTMCGLFAFISVVRLLELPLLRRHLDNVLAARLARAKKSGSMLWPASLLTYALSMILSMGALPASYRSVSRMFGDSSPASSASVVSRTFITANSITPMSPPLALALTAVGLSWTAYAPIGLLVSGVGLAMIGLGPKPTARMEQLEPITGQGTVREFLLIVGSVLGLAIALQKLIPNGGIVASTIVAVLVVVPVWEALTGGGRTFLPRVAALATGERRSWNNQYALLVASALLVAAAVHWGQDTEILAQMMGSGLSPLVVLALVPVAISLGALVGIYPMASLLLVCAVLPPLGEGMWPALVVAASVLGVHVGFLVSPVSGMTLLMAAMSGSSPVSVGLRWNLAFGVAFLLVGTLGVVVVGWATL